jgi:antitoxin (DNA-binding transcriptional repressor) of toxin-antitoxin stability system
MDIHSTDGDTIDVGESPELAAVVDRVVASGKPCRFTRKGETVARLVPAHQPMDALGRGPDWKPDLEAARRSAGAWADVDVDKFISDIYRSRDEAPVQPPLDL